MEHEFHGVVYDDRDDPSDWNELFWLLSGMEVEQLRLGIAEAEDPYLLNCLAQELFSRLDWAHDPLDPDPDWWKARGCGDWAWLALKEHYWLRYARELIGLPAEREQIFNRMEKGAEKNA